jgi:formimidoylglutamate deiminase
LRDHRSVTEASIFADTARLPGRWARDVRVRWREGTIASIEEGATPAAHEPRVPLLLPGMTNLHSHAFQRAMAGLTEVASAGDDDFWSWREWMYRFMARLTPEDVEAIAAQLYVENLKRGVTSLVEFHYLHNDAGGSPYAQRAEMALRIAAAARASGIALTLAPVLYSYGGFGRAPLSAAQRRFGTTVDELLAIVEALLPLTHERLSVGLAPHSLRAAEVAQIRALVNSAPVNAPLHIHGAEQTREVDECVAATGKRPVRLLLDAVGLDSRWCVVHATHLADNEVRDLAASGAVAGLCPSTEADLGDGVFRFVDFAAAGGRFGIGGDSHVCRSPFEELRLLEYSQRLSRRKRNLALHAPGVAIADALWDAAAAGGAQAAARPAGAIAVGRRADLVALALGDPIDDPAGLSHPPELWLSLAVFGGSAARATEVWVGGEKVIADGRHEEEGPIARRFQQTMARLLA